MSVNKANDLSEKKKTVSLGKTNKQITEKRRRARMNSCLQQLKTLVPEAMRKGTFQYSEPGQADIIEMTVEYIRLLQRQQISPAIANDPTVMNTYRSGFNDCVSEVKRYLGNVQNVDIKRRLVNHLTSCSETVNSTTQTTQLQPQQLHIPQQLQMQMSQQQTTVRLNGIGAKSINQSQVISHSLNQMQTIHPTHQSVQLSPAQDTQTQISDAFQIIPVACNIEQLNNNECVSQTSLPVFSLQVSQESVKVIYSPMTIHNKENFSNTDSTKTMRDVSTNTLKSLDFVRNNPIHCEPVNMNMLWRPW